MTKDETKTELAKLASQHGSYPLLNFWEWNFYIFLLGCEQYNPLRIPFWRWWRIGLAKPWTWKGVGAIPLNIDQYLYLIPAKVYRHVTL